MILFITTTVKTSNATYFFGSSNQEGQDGWDIWYIRGDETVIKILDVNPEVRG
jgi:hypothetical protein